MPYMLDQMLCVCVCVVGVYTLHLEEPYNRHLTSFKAILLIGASIVNTKGMAVGSSLTDRLSDRDVMECRIAKASKPFGCFRGSMFNIPLFSTPTKRAVYRAAVLVYGAETWTLKAEHVRFLIV